MLLIIPCFIKNTVDRHTNYACVNNCMIYAYANKYMHVLLFSEYMYT